MLNLELTDHLGNVRAVVGGMKKPGNLPNIYLLSDMYPFGMPMPGRQFVSEEYRFGYQGQERDNEIKGNGNSIDFNYRFYDSRLGRCLTIDPLLRFFPSTSSYSFAMNRIIDGIDYEGLEFYKSKDMAFFVTRMFAK